MLLQKGAEHGLTLHQIGRPYRSWASVSSELCSAGLIMYREDKCSDDDTPVQPSSPTAHGRRESLHTCVSSTMSIREPRYHGKDDFQMWASQSVQVTR